MIYYNKLQGKINLPIESEVYWKMKDLNLDVLQRVIKEHEEQNQGLEKLKQA